MDQRKTKKTIGRIDCTLDTISTWRRQHVSSDSAIFFKLFELFSTIMIMKWKHRQKWGYNLGIHDDVIKMKHFPSYWPFVRGIHRSPVNSPHKCQWRRALTFSLICARIKGWVTNVEAGDLRRHRAHHDVILMIYFISYLGLFCVASFSAIFGNSEWLFIITKGHIDHFKCVPVTLKKLLIPCWKPSDQHVAIFVRWNNPP